MRPFPASSSIKDTIIIMMTTIVICVQCDHHHDDDHHHPCMMQLSSSVCDSITIMITDHHHPCRMQSSSVYNASVYDAFVYDAKGRNLEFRAQRTIKTSSFTSKKFPNEMTGLFWIDIECGHELPKGELVLQQIWVSVDFSQRNPIYDEAITSHLKKQIKGHCGPIIS